MADDEHFRSKDYKGIYYKYESRRYRDLCEGCGRGYHGNRWDAHHVLPGTCFKQIPIEDTFAHDCLKLTEYDINQPYSMAGLPKLTAFILWYQQKEQNVEFDPSKEKLVTMLRWGKSVGQYKNQAHLPVVFPGDFPVHNPVSFGHTDYNDDVTKYLQEMFNKLKNSEAHPKPKEIKQDILDAQDAFWGKLVKFGKGPGGGGLRGIDQNFRNRYGKAKSGWWKPMSMSAKVTSAPASPGMK